MCASCFSSFKNDETWLNEIPSIHANNLLAFSSCSRLPHLGSSALSVDLLLFPSFPTGHKTTSIGCLGATPRHYLQNLVYVSDWVNLKRFRIIWIRGNISTYTFCFRRCHLSHLAAQRLSRTSDPSTLPWTISESARLSALAFAAESQSSGDFFKLVGSN